MPFRDGENVAIEVYWGENIFPFQRRLQNATRNEKLHADMIWNRKKKEKWCWQKKRKDAIQLHVNQGTYSNGLKNPPLLYPIPFSPTRFLRHCIILYICGKTVGLWRQNLSENVEK